MLGDPDPSENDCPCLRMWVVIFGTLLIISSAFVLYLAVQPFAREQEGQPELPLFAPQIWSIGGTLVAVSFLLLGGLCILCGFFGCPSADDPHDIDFVGNHALLQSALIARQQEINEDNSSDDSDNELFRFE